MTQYNLNDAIGDLTAATAALDDGHGRRPEVQAMRRVVRFLRQIGRDGRRVHRAWRDFLEDDQAGFEPLHAALTPIRARLGIGDRRAPIDILNEADKRLGGED